jgi:hypothetical protein
MQQLLVSLFPARAGSVAAAAAGNVKSMRAMERCCQPAATTRRCWRSPCPRSCTWCAGLGRAWLGPGLAWGIGSAKLVGWRDAWAALCTPPCAKALP